jgi:hypothetical protein
MDQLPPELQTHILSFVPKGKLRLVASSRLVGRDANKELKKCIAVAKLRLGLATALMYHIKLLFGRIGEILASHEYFLFNCQPTTLLLDGTCILYGPINQRAYRCRFCNKGRQAHRYVGLMNIYRSLVSKEEAVVL